MVKIGVTSYAYWCYGVKSETNLFSFFFSGVHNGNHQPTQPLADRCRGGTADIMGITTKAKNLESPSYMWYITRINMKTSHCINGLMGILA
jgi:hypothetical protein